MGISPLVDIQKHVCHKLTDSYWLSARDLGLINNWAKEWTCFINSLNLVGIRLSQRNDELVWTGNNTFG